MVWSPRQLADLAGTSRRTVRHYHEIGLLPEPVRQSNGYQQYGVGHLIRLLRARRLASLGFTLPQIVAIGDAERPPAEMLRGLATELEHSIEQMQQARLELAAMLELAAPADLPVDIARRTALLPPPDRAYVTVLSRLLGQEGLEAYLDLMSPYYGHASVVAFEHLTADADEAARASVTASLTDHVSHLDVDHGHLIDTIDREMGGASSPRRRVVQQVVRELFNTAQTDVLHRCQRIRERRHPAPAPSR